MNRFSADTLLHPNIFSVTTYSRLKLMLSHNEAWKKVALSSGVFSYDDIENFGFTNSPAETLIFELGARLCNVGFFCEILKKCDLYNILTLFKEYNPVVIIEQPCNGKEDKMVVRGTELKLTCKGIGIPPPNYQWFRNNEELDAQKESVLHICNFGGEHEGEYYCVLSQDGSSSIKQSSSVSVSLAPEKPIIRVQPSISSMCEIGTKHTLYVYATGHPNVNYQWFKGNTQLNGCTGAELTLDVKDESQDGTYRCYVYNTAGEAWSDESLVTAVALPNPKPSAKVALLIANQLYDNLNRLKTPENDVETLAHLLEGLGFNTISLQNLDLTEMRNAIYNFAEILPSNAYVIFYFSGHGFETCDKFMLPVNAPGPEDYLQTHALCERELLKTILKSQPKVFLELLDMCLNPPDPSNKKIFQEKTNHYEYEANHNLIQGYATTSYSSAYEKRSEENGIYVKHLKEYLTNKKSMPIVEILQNVAKDIAKVCPMQKPFLGTNVTVDYRLTDEAVKSEENSGTESKIKQYSVLPGSLKDIFGTENVRRTSFGNYHGVFLNALQVRISNVGEYKVSCSTFDEILGFDVTQIDRDIVIKIMNVQKLGSPSQVLIVTALRKDGKPPDLAVLKLKRYLVGALHFFRKIGPLVSPCSSESDSEAMVEHFTKITLHK